MTTRMKPETWNNIDRNTKLAYVMYPDKAPTWAQDAMRRMSAAEGKRAPVGVPDAPTRSKVVWAQPKPSKYR